jgi:hypothetical protein
MAIRARRAGLRSMVESTARSTNRRAKQISKARKA